MDAIEFIGISWVRGGQYHARFAPTVPGRPGNTSNNLAACALSIFAKDSSEERHRPAGPIETIITGGLMKNFEDLTFKCVVITFFYFWFRVLGQFNTDPIFQDCLRTDKL